MNYKQVKLRQVQRGVTDALRRNSVTNPENFVQTVKSGEPKFCLGRLIHRHFMTGFKLYQFRHVCDTFRFDYKIVALLSLQRQQQILHNLPILYNKILLPVCSLYGGTVIILSHPILKRLFKLTPSKNSGLFSLNS